MQSFALLAAALLAGGEFENRWVYFTTPLTSDENVSQFSNVVTTAKAGGMNGVVLACGLEFYTCWPGDRKPRLKAIKKLCDELGMDIIPSMYSLGYGSMINYGTWRLEGVPVEGWKYVAKGGKLVPAAPEPVDLGKVFRQNEKGMNRLIASAAKVADKSRYRLSCRAKTASFSAKRKIELWALEHGRDEQFVLIGKRPFDFSPTQDWTLCEADFNVPEGVKSLDLYAGCQGGQTGGTLELDGFKLERIAPSNVLKRPGAPIMVRNAASGIQYALDKDFTAQKCRRPEGCKPAPFTEFAIPAGSAIKDGDELVVNCYVPGVVDGNQVSTCLSEPSLYEIIEKSVRKVEELLSPKKWQISIDEFRNGGTCAACKARGLSMAEIYGDAVTKIHGFIVRAHPGAEVHMWSDMLDPNHNGVKRYYNCRGSFEDAWKFIPKDIVIDCWYDRKSELSLKFFSSHGFRTLAAAYYDEKPPFEYSRRWRDAGRKTDGYTGYMYTTWRQSYADLPAFCSLMDSSQ